MQREPTSMVLKGLLEGLILQSLEEAPIHGYGFLKELDRMISQTPRKGRVYRVLSSLEEEGLVEPNEVDDGGRSRRVYHLTPTGRQRLEAYRDLPGELEDRLARLFGLDNAEPLVRLSAPADGSQQRQRPDAVPPGRGGDASWVPDALEDLPGDASVQVPGARFSLERAPGSATWTLTVENHPARSYEGSDRCPLAFLYGAIVQLLIGGPQR